MSSSGKKKITAIVAACVVAGAIGITLTGMVGPGGGGGMGGGVMVRGGMSGGQRGGSEEGDQAARKTVVETAAPSLGEIAVSGSFVGTVEPGRQVTVYPKASGEVLEANFGVGDAVEAGAVLFRLDSSTLELDIAQTQENLRIAQSRAALGVETAKQNLETAQRNLENYTNNVEDGLNSSLLQAEASVKSAENSLYQRNIDLRIARDNYRDYLNNEWEGDYSDSQRATLRDRVVQEEAKLEAAQLALENAKANLEAVKKQIEEQTVTTETSVTTAEIGVKTAELGTDFSAENIALEIKRKNLENYTGKSPISGIIEQKNIEAYNTVSAQTAAYVISNKDLLSVSFGVAESALSYLKPGDSVTIEKNGETCEGTVAEVSTMVDPASGLYTVRADVENAPFELHSGSAVKLRAVTQRVENGMILPIDAVYYDNGVPHVYIFENNTARKVEIEAGISDDTNIHVKSGLSMSDQVIVTWSASLYDGAEVYLSETAPREPEAGQEGLAEGDGARDSGQPPERREGAGDGPRQRSGEAPPMN